MRRDRITSYNVCYTKLLRVYTLATVGDGLCSQIPALLVSTATGIIVTRSATKDSFGQDLSKQMFSQPYVFYILGGMLALVSFIPGLPTPLMLILARITSYNVCYTKLLRIYIDNPIIFY